MSLVKRGQIANCQPNALMTLKEYLEDHASSETKEEGRTIRGGDGAYPEPQDTGDSRMQSSGDRGGKRDLDFRFRIYE